jgi:hypothetical protein
MSVMSYLCEMYCRLTEFEATKSTAAATAAAESFGQCWQRSATTDTSCEHQGQQKYIVV